MEEPSKPAGPKPTPGSSKPGDPGSAPGDEAASTAAARLPWFLAGWAGSSLLLIAAIAVLLLTNAALLGVVLFILGAIGTVVVSIGLLRARATVRRSGS